MVGEVRHQDGSFIILMHIFVFAIFFFCGSVGLKDRQLVMVTICGTNLTKKWS